MLGSPTPFTDPVELVAPMGAGLPFALHRDVVAEAIAAAAGSIAFAFTWRDVPFSAAVARRNGEAVLAVRGAVGPMPFTIEAARRRQRALRTLAEASRWTGLVWRLTATQEIGIEGEAPLTQPVSPAAMITGAVGILWRADRYLVLLLDVLGDSACLNLSAAA